MLDYRTHVENKSLYNTPNTWGIYIISLVCKWLKEKGGLAAMHRENEEKAALFTTRSTPRTSIAAMPMPIRARS